jgi:ribosomal protein S27AE
MPDTTIRRSVAGTIGAAAVSLACAAGAIWAFGEGNWVVVVVAGLIGAVCGAVAIVGPRKAKCPHCGGTMGADSSRVHHCGSCGQYARTEGGKLVKLEPDYVDPQTVFPVSLDRLLKPGLVTGLPTSNMQDVRWPNICLVCSAPATGVDQVEVVVDRGGGAMSTRVRMRLPFSRCGRHPIGVGVDETRHVWHGDGWECDHAQLRFNSHRYWREFCRLNNTDQRRAGLQR